MIPKIRLHQTTNHPIVTKSLKKITLDTIIRVKCSVRGVCVQFCFQSTLSGIEIMIFT